MDWSQLVIDLDKRFGRHAAVQTVPHVAANPPVIMTPPRVASSTRPAQKPLVGVFGGAVP